MKRLNIAPAEENIPTDYLNDKFLEEKAFPHLFPSGEGGYVSTYKKNRHEIWTICQIKDVGKRFLF